MKIARMGMFAAIMLASVGFASAASAAGTMTICGGVKGGNYDFTANAVAQQLAGAVDVAVLNTAGSGENLDKLASGECDVAITQSDALYVYSKEKGPLAYYNVSNDGLYTEFATLLCNRNSGVAEWGDLSGKGRKIFAGEHGSGAEITARGLKAADIEMGGGDYKDLAILNSSADASLVKVKSRSADCMFYVGAKGNKLMSINAEKLAADLVIVPVEDKDFNDVTMKDANGNEISVWNPVTMPSDTYGKIMPAGTLYGNKSVKTIGVNSFLIASQKWADANEDAFTQLGLTIGDVVNAVRADKHVELIAQ